MKNIKTALFRTIAVIAFTGLTIGVSTGTRCANADTGYGDNGYGGQVNQDSTDTINSTGSGSGGSTDYGTPDTGSSYGSGSKEEPTGSTGSGTGGSTDQGTGYDTSGSTGFGSNYGTGTGPNYGTAPLGGPSGNGMGDPGPVK